MVLESILETFRVNDGERWVERFWEKLVDCHLVPGVVLKDIPKFSFQIAVPCQNLVQTISVAARFINHNRNKALFVLLVRKLIRSRQVHTIFKEDYLGKQKIKA